jgi:hypothetical protein
LTSTRPSPGGVAARASARADAARLSAVIVTDATALSVVGLSPRQFRAFVRVHGIPHVRSGRRTLVRVDRLLEVVDRLSGAPARASDAAWDEGAVVAAAARGSK